MKPNDPLHDADSSRTNDRSSAKPSDVTRRKFLATSAVGIAGLGAVGSTAAASNEHTLIIEGMGSSVPYSFTVGGNLQKSTAEGASTDPLDEIVGQSAHGVVKGGKDAYTFTGPLYSFDFDSNQQLDVINVTLDGEAAHVDHRPDHTLLIEGFGPDTSYSFAAGGIEKSDAYGASKNPLDKVNGYGAMGAVQNGKDAYTYDGELQAFEFDQDGIVRVTIDGKAAHVGQRPDQAMILFLERRSQDAEYEVTVSGSIRDVLHDDQGQEVQGYTISGNTISGSIWGASYDMFTFDGEIETLNADKPEVLELYSNYHKIL